MAIPAGMFAPSRATEFELTVMDALPEGGLVVTLPVDKIRNEAQFLANLKSALDAGHQAQVRWWPHTDHDDAIIGKVMAMGPNVQIFRN